VKKRVSSYLQKKKNNNELIHFTLIDPEKTVNDLDKLKNNVRVLEEAGTDCFLIGGSTGISQHDVDLVVRAVKEVSNLPVILFPGNVTGISKYADAILFMSLLNSDDPYFIIGAQVLGAPLVLKYGLEPLPTAYIIVGYGGAAGYIGKARPIPFERPEIGAAYALAASMLGMKYIYFEAGSGSPRPVPLEFVKFTRKLVNNDIFVIVGGGLRDPEYIKKLHELGANGVVTGTILEEDLKRGIKLIEAIKKK